MKNNRYLCIILVLFLYVITPSTPSKAQQDNKDIKRILVLYYDNKGAISSWIDKFDDGLHSALSDQAGKVLEMNIEYTDLARNSSKTYRDKLLSMFEMKYGLQPPDIVLANMNPSSDFLKEVCNLFPNAKLILAVSESSFQEILEQYNPETTTGIYMEMRHDASPDFIGRILPDTRNIFVINGNSPIEQIDIESARKAFDRYNDRYNISYLTGMNVDAIIQKVSALPEDSVIYFMTYLMDPSETPYLSMDVLSLISENANAPIISFHDHYMGKGILGGNLISAEKMGNAAGEMVLKILGGENPADIRPVKVSIEKMFDWRQLQKWGIDEGLLPEGSVIKYREYSFFERYKGRIILWGSLVAVQSLLIAFLLMTLRRRRRAEEALFNSERKYRRLVESTRDAIIAIDMNDLIASCNIGATEIFGYETDEMVGHSIMMLASEEEREREAANIKGILETDSFIEYESMMIKKKGVLFPVKINMSALKNESDEIIGLIKIIRDISEQKAAEEEKKRLELALRQSQKMEAIGTLAGGIAHDFNNILTVVLGYTELVLFNVRKGSKDEAGLHEVLKAGRRAKDLVNQILTYARKTHEEVKPVLIGPIADEALKLLRSTVPSSIEIKKNIETESLVMADMTRIHQIFLNICTNAVQAMEMNGGVLTVNVTDIFLNRNNGMKQGDYIKISISDTGSGIPKENLELIFDPYFTTKQTGEGTGLGLSVVHGIVEKYGGKIIVESELDRGTTFTVYLPVTKLHYGAEEHEYEGFPRGAERILFVDDEPSIIEMTGRLLGALGYKMTLTGSSMEALELFRKRPYDFDLVITDMTMPQMNGDRLSSELIRIRDDIPIILCTGYSKTISKETALSLGVSEFLMKPIEYSILAKTVRRVLDASGI